MKNKILRIFIYTITTLLITMGILQLIINLVIGSDDNIIQAVIQNTNKISKLTDGEDENKTVLEDSRDFVSADSITKDNDTGGTVPPEINGEQPFCIEPGVGSDFDYKKDMKDGDGYFTYDNYLGEIERGEYTKDCVEEDGHSTKDIPLDAGGENKWAHIAYTPVYYKYTKTVDLPPALAYIFSSNTSDKSDEELLNKQHAVWNLRGSGYDQGLIGTEDPFDDPDNPTDGDQPSTYDNDAISYANYYNRVTASGGLNPVDTSGITVGVQVDQEKQEYIVGPFSLSYIDTAPYAGISNMYCIGYNSAGSVVRSSIAIKRVITGNDITGSLNGQGEKLDFFNPSQDDKLDSQDRNYPKSGESFYVVFDNPNTNILDNSTDRVVYVSIKVKFQYMVIKQTAELYEGTEWKITYEHNDDYNTHTHKKETGTEFVEEGITTTDEDTTVNGKCSIPNCVSHEYDEKTGQWKHTCGHTETTYEEYACHGCQVTISGEEMHCQDLMIPHTEREVYEQEVELGRSIPFTMNLGGTVWEENFVGKEDLANGLIDATELLFKNIKVTLYTESGAIATLLYGLNNNINPIYTDEKGNYTFSGLDPMKKYYVTFEYNGQIYTPTEYMVNTLQNWNINSKATEENNERNSYDSKFASIGSYPANYKTSNSLGLLQGEYNTTFSRLELMGYTLGADGKYIKTGIQLIDGHLYTQEGLETAEYSDGVISTRVREFIKQNNRFPNSAEMIQIYKNIANGNTDILKKLQFIEDCKITAYTKSQNGKKDLYPVKSQFILQESGTAINLEGKTYSNIYPEQYHVNLGLWRRTKTDIAISKDVYKVGVTINGQAQSYEYDSRDKQYNDEYEKPYDITVRLSNSDLAYYTTTYNRAIYEADAESYKNSAIKEKLQVYVTYKIVLYNDSQGIRTRINEIVDYYDKDYTLVPEMSWAMYGDSKSDVRLPNAKEAYDEMLNLKGVKYGEGYFANYKQIASLREDNKSEKQGLKYYEYSQYGEATESKVEGCQALYLKLNDRNEYTLKPGQSEYIYLTFKVNDKIGANGEYEGLKLDENRVIQNVAEINGYTTWYNDNTVLPNGIKKGSNDYAGIIDVDSNPGNYVKEDGNKYLEDDTDIARGIKIYADSEWVREINGTTWEDKRTYSPDGTNALVGNGVYDNGEVGVGGITVTLHEVKYERDGNGNIVKQLEETPAQIYNKETGTFIEARAITDANGGYRFEGYVPGDYVVRFTYNGENYNGQNYKSTTYQKGINQNGKTVVSNPNSTGYIEYNGYTNVEGQNETATYGYDIKKADELGLKISDAKDIWSKREEFYTHNNGQYVNGVTNATASSDEYLKPEMKAETGVIRVEVEYNRENSSGNSNKVNNASDNNVNGNYNIRNVDFGLEERPKAGLELNEKVSNVRIILANQTVLFDATQSVEDLIWQAKTLYNINDMKKLTNYDFGPEASANKEYVYSDYTHYNDLRNYILQTYMKSIVGGNNRGLIQITMDEEIMHGATIEITYDMAVTNIGEEDYNDKYFYYTGEFDKNLNSTQKAEKIKNTIVKTSADEVISYVENNLQYNHERNSENGWKVITQSETQNYIDNTIYNSKVKDKYNTILLTTGLSGKLVPVNSETKLEQGKSKLETRLILKQTITSQNTSDDLLYKNITEIVSISNDVGRKMAYSTQGNQDPTIAPTEPDASRAEDVVILPPFGEHYLYIGLGLFILTLLTISIIVIKKTVLR